MTPAAPHEHAAEEAARRTIEGYFSAIYAGDTHSLGHLFAPSATLAGWDEGELKSVPRDRWLQFVETIPSPQSLGDPLDSEILDLEVFGTAAVAKVREYYRNFYYVEFLALLWTGDRWQITHKCYHQFAGDAR
jgi:hypothetical protein